jgi:predicted N-acetyltransferase YhbS
VTAHDVPSTRPAIEQAIEVLVHGFCFGRSLTYPHAAQRVDQLWWLRDAERPDPADYRNEEWVAFRIPPRHAHQSARRLSRGRYVICAVLEPGEDEHSLCATYQNLGYRLLIQEPLFAHTLQKIPEAASAARIELVRTRQSADRFAQVSGLSPIRDESLSDDAPALQYIAWVHGEIVGWVRSVRVRLKDCDASWVANMHVREEYRGRGIGTAMLAQLMQVDQQRGIERSVLLASPQGAMFYPHLGYQKIGQAFIYTPQKC